MLTNANQCKPVLTSANQCQQKEKEIKKEKKIEREKKEREKKDISHTIS